MSITYIWGGRIKRKESNERFTVLPHRSSFTMKGMTGIRKLRESVRSNFSFCPPLLPIYSSCDFGWKSAAKKMLWDLSAVNDGHNLAGYERFIKLYVTSTESFETLFKVCFIYPKFYWASSFMVCIFFRFVVVCFLIMYYNQKKWRPVVRLEYVTIHYTL